MSKRKILSIKMDDKKKNVSLEYDRILCVSIAKCPFCLSHTLVAHISDNFLESSKSKVTRLTDPYIMNVCNLDYIVDRVASAYKSRHDILLCSFNPDVMGRIRAEQFRNRNWKVDYYTVSIELDEDEIKKPIVIRPVKTKSRLAGNADNLDIDGLYEPFALASDKTTRMMVENVETDNRKGNRR